MLAGAADVDLGTPNRRLAWLRTIRKTRKLRGRKLLARWTAPEMEQRSRRAAGLLADATLGSGATAALMYGTDFFPAAQGQDAPIPVGAALDTTFAQLARSAEDKFALLSTDEIEHCVEHQRRVFERCDWIFPRSKWCAESLLEDYGVPSSKLVITGAGPNFDVLPEERPTSNGHDLRTVLFVGRDWHRKNGPLVLDAFRLARNARPDLRLVIVGQSEPEQSSPGVEWLGALDGGARERLGVLYREASLMLCPSRFEPFGIALLEAMVAECPVVALDRGAAREIIEDGVSGTLLRTPEPRALADTILHWLEDADRLAAGGRSARARVLCEYSWDSAAERISSALL